MSQAAIDAGLRQFMISVYNYMASGLSLTGIVAYAAAETGLYASLIDTPVLFWGVTLAPLALVLFLSFRIEKMSLGTAKTAFWAYAALVGLSLSGIFFVYTGTSIARTFFITAATFLAMSLFGYTTRADLARTASFLLMGLVGNHHREHRECIFRIFDRAAGYFGDWRHRVRRTDRLRHAAHQGDLSEQRQPRNCRQERRSWARLRFTLISSTSLSFDAIHRKPARLEAAVLIAAIRAICLWLPSQAMLLFGWRAGVSIITEMRRPGTAQHVASRSWMGSRTFPRGTCSRNRLHPHQAGINSLDCVQTKVHGDATW